MESALDYHTAKALLEWQVELGVDETLADAPIDRYALEDSRPKPKAAAQKMQAPPKTDPVAEARQMASAVQDLSGLAAAMAQFPHCTLQKGAKQLVFADGTPGARIMIIGEAPGRDEDREGKPFVGRAGHLLDRMLAAIHLDRTAADPERGVYITNVLPWRPPQNRDPRPEEIAMMVPFLERHIALANPDILIAMGNMSCQALLEKRGISRLRGQWAQAFGKPVLPMFHPTFLLRNTAAKREAWADLLAVRSKLNEAP